MFYRLSKRHSLLVQRRPITIISGILAKLDGLASQDHWPACMLAYRLRIEVNKYLFVSGNVNWIKTTHTPAKIVVTQYTQRQEVPDTAMKPLIVGAIDGPANGANVKRENAFPRVLASQISAMIPLGAFC